MIAARVARTLARNVPKSLLKVGNISSFSSYLTESKGSLLSKSRNFRARAELKHFNLTCKTGIRPTLDQFLGEFPISYFAHSVFRENSLLLQLYKQFCQATNSTRQPVRIFCIKNLKTSFRTQIVTLNRLCKENYFKTYFETNKKDSKRIWYGVKTN